MPVYEYRCQQCQQSFERVQPMRMSSSNVACTHCGSWITQRIYTSAPNMIIRPPGYNLHPDDPGYSNLTDYRPAQPKGRK